MADMTIVEDKIRELEVHGTRGVTVVTSTALSLALLLAQYSFSPVEFDHNRIKLPGTQGTISQSLSLQITAMDLFSQINRVYDNLLKNQIDLDADSKRALYANLWDLYT